MTSSQCSIRHFTDIYNFFTLILIRIFCGHQRSRITFTIAIVLSIILAIIVQIHVVYITWICLKDAQNFISNVCHLYKEGSADGNLCESFCENLIQPELCHTTHLAKAMVFSATYRKQRVVVKSKLSHLSDYEPLVIDRDPFTGLPNLKAFANMVKDALRLHFRLPPDHLNFGENGSEILPNGFPWSIHPRNLDSSSLNSLWSLLQQEEYLMFGYFKNSNVFPKIIGTCGHVYVTEYLRPMSELVDLDWPFRAEIARRMLALIDDVDTLFHQPLHLCDVKLENFGIDSSATVKILDADTVYFEDVLKSTIKAQDSCSSHRDCSFFSCKIQCDGNVGRCRHEVRNNNLQAVCENIFFAPWESWLPISKSLLHSAPKVVKGALQSTLKQCTYPEDFEEPEMRGKTQYSTRQHLFRLLLVIR